MSDQADKKARINTEKDDDTTATGAGGQGSQVGFVDFIGSDRVSRDDLLPKDQKKHLLAIHEDKNKQAIEKQKEKLDFYQQVKKQSLAQRKQGMGLQSAVASAGVKASHKPHPLLQDKFSHADDNTTPNPNDYQADTNEADQANIENEYQLTNRPQFQPAPSNTPRLTSTPKLTPR